MNIIDDMTGQSAFLNLNLIISQQMNLTQNSQQSSQSKILLT